MAGALKNAPTPRELEVRRAKLRIALGWIQMAGVGSALTLAILTGMSQWTLGVTLFTCIATIVSLVLFRKQG